MPSKRRAHVGGLLRGLKLRVHLLLGGLLISTLLSSTAVGDVDSVVNQLRGGGCNKQQLLPPLSSDARLQAAVQRVANGENAQLALDAVGYPVNALSSIHLSGYRQDALVRQLLQAKHCASLMDAKWQQLGVVQRAEDIWIVLATPRSMPVDVHTTEQRVLALVNQARAVKRRCGDRQFAATSALRLNAMLTQAAQLHAQDMAKHRQMQHQGSDGSTPAQRITQQGYRWKAVGENVAAGSGSAEEVVTGWLHSPGHCANIMNPAFTEMGVAYAVNQHDEYAVYWAQDFATAR